MLGTGHARNLGRMSKSLLILCFLNLIVVTTSLCQIWRWGVKYQHETSYDD
jgi:hypothetical protein